MKRITETIIKVLKAVAGNWFTQNVIGELAGDLIESVSSGIAGAYRAHKFTKSVQGAVEEFLKTPGAEAFLEAASHVSKDDAKSWSPAPGTKGLGKMLANSAKDGAAATDPRAWDKKLQELPESVRSMGNFAVLEAAFKGMLLKIQKQACEYWKSLLDSQDLAIVNLIARTVAVENEDLKEFFKQEIQSYLFVSGPDVQPPQVRVLQCTNCGKDFSPSRLQRTESGLFTCNCPDCGTALTMGSFTEEGQHWAKSCSEKLDTVLTQLAGLSSRLDEILEEIRCSERDARERAERNLRQAVGREHPSRDEVVACANAVLQHDAEAFLAQFYLAAYSENYRETAAFLDAIDEEAHFGDLEEIVRFMTKRPDGKTVLPVRRLIERTQERFKGESKRLREDVLTAFEEEMKKFDDGIYDVSRSRQVFVAYKTEDYAAVRKLVECLEENGDISCFVALRNLQNGLNAEDYRKSLETAIDHCSVFVLVSSHLSRTQGGARDEMEYVRKKDFDLAPSTFRARNAYRDIPEEYKKPRVEYLIEEYQRGEKGGLADEFFSGQTYRTTAEEVRERVRSLINAPLNIYRWCVHCHTRLGADVQRCYNCGGTVFAASLEEAVERRAEERTRAEYEKRLIEEKERRKKAEEEAEEKRKAEAEAIEKQVEERIRAEYEKRLAEERKNAEEARRRLEEETKRKAEEEAARQRAAEEERLKKEEEDRKKAEEAENKRRAEEAATQARKAAEEEAERQRKAAEEEDRRKKAEEAENRRRAEEAATQQRKAAEEEARRKAAEEEAKQKYTTEAEQRLKAEGVEILPESALLIKDGVLKGGNGTANIETGIHYGVIIPEGVTKIGVGAFQYCPWLKRVVIPETVTSIGMDAFQCCRSLTNIVIPKAVTSIGMCAFTACSSLTSITIPEGVTEIGKSAFLGCDSLADISISKSVTSIGEDAFYKCPAIEKIEVADGNGHYHVADGRLIETASGKVLAEICESARKAAEAEQKNATEEVAEEAKQKSAAEQPREEVEILPESALIIEDGVLKGFASKGTIEKFGVVIPEGVTEIGDKAFRGCRLLTSVTIPTSVTKIGDNAFDYCDSLTSITIPASVTEIGEKAFSGCDSLASITIPKGVTAIGHDAFGFCGSLTMIEVEQGNPVYHSGGNCLIETESKTLIAGCATSVIPNDGSVSMIGEVAFSGRDLLTSIAIPEGVTAIENFAFASCFSLTNIVIPEGVKSIGFSAFAGCESLASVTIPSSVIEMGDNAFEFCTSLANVTILEGVKSIGRAAFAGCGLLTSVTIPKSVRSIGSYSFKECGLLTSITIPEGVISIEERAFWCCSSLTSISIPESVTVIRGDAFEECFAIEKIEVARRNKHYHVANGLLVETASGKIIAKINEQKYEVEVTPAQRKKTAKEAERRRKEAEEARQKKAEEAEKKRKEAEEARQKKAEEAEKKRKEAAQQKKVAEDEERQKKASAEAQAKQKAPLEQVKSGEIEILPESALEIQNGVLKRLKKSAIGTSGVKYGVVIPEGVTEIGEFAFYYDFRMLASVTIPKTVRTIGSHAFSYCSSLKSIIIPEGVTTIAKNAFEQCVSLESVTIPSSVRTIESFAFDGCKSLKNITIPAGVTEIEPSAFSGCDALASAVFQKRRGWEIWSGVLKPAPQAKAGGSSAAARLREKTLKPVCIAKLEEAKLKDPAAAARLLSKEHGGYTWRRKSGLFGL